MYVYRFNIFLEYKTGSYTGYRLRKLAVPLRTEAVYQDYIKKWHLQLAE